MAPTAVGWRDAFRRSVANHAARAELCEAAMAGRLRPWTEALTAVVVATCAELGWHAAAKGASCEVLPIRRCEYLSLDAMAFRRPAAGWQYPVAAFELENSRSQNTVAYALWKLLCVETDLRVLYCYRKQRDEIGPMVDWLANTVVAPMLRERLGIMLGDTVVVVGTRAAAETFPDGFFHWWVVDAGAGRLRLM